jgi:hypothetical protein
MTPVSNKSKAVYLGNLSTKIIIPSFNLDLFIFQVIDQYMIHNIFKPSDEDLPKRLDSDCINKHLYNLQLEGYYSLSKVIYIEALPFKALN